jgi:hypothetical protein
LSIEHQRRLLLRINVTGKHTAVYQIVPVPLFMVRMRRYIDDIMPRGFKIFFESGIL